MSTEKHTQGEWAIGESTNYWLPIVDERGDYIAAVTCRTFEDEARANGRLIAAAPTILAALLGFINPTGHTDACAELRSFGVSRCTKVCERAREAIAKAREL
jgi:hypothetical protein